MSKFKNFINEGGTSYATRMELTIVQLWNGASENELTYKKQYEEGSNIVGWLKNGILKNEKGKAVHTGSDNKDSITKEWAKWGGVDATPKTDLTIGAHRISLKQSGGSQLMSAKAGEAKATAHAAVGTLDTTSQGERDRLISGMEDYISQFIQGKTKEVGVRDTKKKRGKGDPEVEVALKKIDAGDAVHAKFTKWLQKEMEKNPNFKKAVVFEAMSGDVKFGTDKTARAGKLLVFEKDKGINNEWHLVDDDAYITKKTAGSKVVVRWKSSSSGDLAKGTKKYTWYSSLRINEEIERRINEEFAKYTDNDILNEGIGDILKKVKNKVSGWFKNVWKRISTWLSESWNNVLAFFGLTPYVTSVVVKF